MGISWNLWHILTLALAFTFTLAFVPPIKIIAQKLGFVSKIDFRRRELAPRPLLGGIAIFTGFLLANFASNSLPLSLVLPGLVLVTLGVLDDKFELRAKIKMACNLGAVALWLALTPASSLLLVKIGLPVPVAYALHAFWVVGLINAFNMIDGMDGLASGMAVFGFFFLGWFLPGELGVFSWSISAACLAHLVFNRPPASIFLGDSGSLLLGFLMSALGSRIDINSTSATSILIPLFALAHPEIDAILAMARRWKAGTPLFHGDKDHIHHKLRRIGLGPYGSLAVTYFASAYCGVTALVIESLLTGPTTAIVGLLAFLSISGVGSLLGAVYFAEHRLAAQFSQIGTPMLHRHIAMTTSPEWPTGRYQAVVFDLLPYYKELQERGIADLNLFIEEFAAWINVSFRDGQIIPAGSYSVIVVAPVLQRDQILNSFKSIVASRSLLKNDVGVPWGLHFYTDSTDAQAFERKFGPFLGPRVVDSSKAA